MTSERAKPSPVAKKSFNFESVHLKPPFNWRHGGVHHTPAPRCKSESESCTMLTTGPSSLVADLQDRMPVIVPPEKYDLWRDPDVADL
ncbi:MAG TPA: SOS response-associated peptidase family protein [Candidatus Acidoferrum sp.]|nr:SOS response-associated peptidase family protein [Candidatus Acidoferrum sp.]